MFLGRGPFATSSPPCHLLFTPSLWRCHILLHLYVQFQGITWWNAPFCLSFFFLSFFIFFFSSPSFLKDKCFYWCASVCPYVCLSLSAPLPVSISQCFSSSFIVSFYLSCSLSFCLSVCCGGGGVDEHWFVNGGWKPGREGVGTTKSSPLAKLIRTLATLYQNKHQFCSCATTRSSTSRTPSTPRLRTGKCSRTWYNRLERRQWPRRPLELNLTPSSLRWVCRMT